jgi:hypothetical protein
MTFDELLDKIPKKNKKHLIEEYFPDCWEIINVKVKVKDKWHYLNFINKNTEILHIGNPYLKLRTLPSNFCLINWVESVKILSKQKFSFTESKNFN